MPTLTVWSLHTYIYHEFFLIETSKKSHAYIYTPHSGVVATARAAAATLFLQHKRQ